jgi:hypothetical protein
MKSFNRYFLKFAIPSPLLGGTAVVEVLAWLMLKKREFLFV